MFYSGTYLISAKVTVMIERCRVCTVFRFDIVEALHESLTETDV